MERLINFAKKVTVPSEMRKEESNFVAKKHELFLEINKFKVSIDKECFHKSKHERKIFKEIKAKYKKGHSAIREEFLSSFIASSIPNWGGVNFIVLN